MKNYFNQQESAMHLVLMTAMLQADNLIKGNCITSEEIKMLKKAIKNVSDFSESVFERLGDGYKRSLKNKASMNTLRLVSRNCHHTNNAEMEDFIDADILREIITSNYEIDCACCKREDCKQCGIYKIKSYLHYEGKNDDTNLCPFRKEELKIDEIDFGDF